MATELTYKTARLVQKRSAVRSECTTRSEYLDALKVLSTIHDWSHANIGVLRSDITGSGSHWTAESRADGHGLQTQNEGSAHAARVKAIGSMRAWVVRNIQDEASKARAESMEPGPAEQRALELLRAVDGHQVVRYRGGSWAPAGLLVEGPGKLPVLDARGATGISTLRKLAAKGRVVLDEQKGEATLN